jgi:hypothetical protein
MGRSRRRRRRPFLLRDGSAMPTEASAPPLLHGGGRHRRGERWRERERRAAEVRSSIPAAPPCRQRVGGPIRGHGGRGSRRLLSLRASIRCGCPSSTPAEERTGFIQEAMTSSTMTEGLEISQRRPTPAVATSHLLFFPFLLPARHKMTPCGARELSFPVSCCLRGI